jgi:DNA repair protein RadC
MPQSIPIKTQDSTCPHPYPKESDDDILNYAKTIMESRFKRSRYLNNPSTTRDYLKLTLANKERECFGVVYLDSQNGVLAFSILFEGTIDGAVVYPREVVKESLNHNAAAVILVHNHPSGNPEPSEADKTITKRLIEALSIIDIRVLDHLIVGGNDITSLAERGLL